MLIKKSPCTLCGLQNENLLKLSYSGRTILVELLWLTFFDGIDRPGQLCYILSISNDLPQMVNISTWIPDFDSYGPALLDIFLPSDTIICSTMASPPLGKSDHVVVSVSINFQTNSKNRMLHFIA